MLDQRGDAMGTVFSRAAGAACLALGLASVASAQVKPAARVSDSGVHRMEILNGSMRSVHYVSAGMPVTEQTTLRELERAENEVALSDQLAALRRQYVNDERFMQNRRQVVQQLLYGYSSDLTGGFYPGTSIAAYPFGTYGYGFPYAYGYGYGVGPYLAGGYGTASQSLAYGIGDEGAIKTDIAKTLATQAGPEHAAVAARQFDSAVARAAESEPIRTALGLPKREGVAYAGLGGEPVHLTRAGTKVVVTRRVGDATDKVEGEVVREDGDWIVVRTAAGQRTISKGTVLDILEPEKK
jgi:hypothetical protein